jgi:hypothetical protein
MISANPRSGRTRSRGSSPFVDDAEQVAGKYDEPRGFLWSWLHIAVARRVLAMSDRTGKEMHLGLALAHDESQIGEWSAVGMKSFSHQCSADKVIRISDSLTVGGFSDGYFDFLEGLKNRDVVIAAQKLRPDLLCKSRLQ